MTPDESTLKRRFAVSCLMTKHKAMETITTHVLCIRSASNADEAIGSAILASMELKPGYSVDDVTLLEIKP